MSQVLHEDRDNGVCLITLNDPDHLNAMGEDMAEEFQALTEKLSARDDLRAIILTGAGRAFSAGGHLDMLEKKTRLSAEENHSRMMKFYHSFLSLRNPGVPVIAAINGHAIGAGMCLASACDIRIAAEEAKLGFTFVKLGLHPGMGATYFLPRLIGVARSIELMTTGRVIKAPEAAQIGLISRVVSAEEVLDTALSTATEVTSGGPESIKQLVETMRGDSTALEAALQREAQCQAVNYAGEEFAEGVRAAIEKRPPAFVR